MKLIIDSKENIDKMIANEFATIIKSKESPIIGLATGSTPIGVYDNLIKMYKNGELSFKNVTSFNLDEYVGLAPTHDQSYRYFMNTHLFDHVDIDKNRTFIPSDDKNSDNFYEKYDAKIEKFGGVDIQILGIGSNGHIAFNEPQTSFDSKTHIVTLKESTIKDNARFFESINDVPRQAISMGLATICKARKIVLVAYGLNKANAIYKLFKEGMTEDLPASILQGHPDVTIYCDKDAASKL